MRCSGRSAEFGSGGIYTHLPVANNSNANTTLAISDDMRSVQIDLQLLASDGIFSGTCGTYKNGNYLRVLRSSLESDTIQSRMLTENIGIVFRVINRQHDALKHESKFTIEWMAIFVRTVYLNGLLEKWKSQDPIEYLYTGHPILMGYGQYELARHLSIPNRSWLEPTGVAVATR